MFGPKPNASSLFRLNEAEGVPQAEHMLAADPAFVDHAGPDVEDHREANVVDPMIPLDKSGDVVRSETHEEHREGEADHQQCRIVPSYRGDQKHIVEAHA